MAVIAVTSGMGTGVKYVAEHVARHLGLELVHREIGEAGRAVAPDTHHTVHESQRSRCWAGRPSPLVNHHTVHESQRSRWDAGLAWLNAAGDMGGLDELESVCRLAQRGNVLICGVTPLHFLSDLTEVIKVRVRTTMALRVRRIMACMGTDQPDMALAKILLGDQRQSDALRRMFKIDDAENPDLYDLVIDTGREPAENCALQIVKWAARPRENAARTRWAKLDTMLDQIRSLRSHPMQETQDGNTGSCTRSP